MSFEKSSEYGSGLIETLMDSDPKIKERNEQKFLNFWVSQIWDHSSKMNVDKRMTSLKLRDHSSF